MEENRQFWGYATKSFADALVVDELTEEESNVYRENTRVVRDELNFDD